MEKREKMIRKEVKMGLKTKREWAEIRIRIRAKKIGSRKDRKKWKKKKKDKKKNKKRRTEKVEKKKQKKK